MVCSRCITHKFNNLFIGLCLVATFHWFRQTKLQPQNLNILRDSFLRGNCNDA